MTQNKNAARLENEAALESVFGDLNSVWDFTVSLGVSYFPAQKKYSEALKEVPKITEMNERLREMLLRESQQTTIAELVERIEIEGSKNDKEVIKVYLNSASFVGEVALKRGMV